VLRSKEKFIRDLAAGFEKKVIESFDECRFISVCF